MIHIKDHKTPDMFDPFPFLGPKRKQRIETFWAKIFREYIFHLLSCAVSSSPFVPVSVSAALSLFDPWITRNVGPCLAAALKEKAGQR